MSKRTFNLIATKKPRDVPIPDKPINFPPLENLHLELLENKKKIKPGLPNTISPQKKKPTIIKKEVSSGGNSKENPPKKEIPPKPSSLGGNSKKEVSFKEETSQKEISKEISSKSKNSETLQKKSIKEVPPKPDPEELLLNEIIDDEDDLEEDLEKELGDSDLDTGDDLELDTGDDLELDEDDLEIDEEGDDFKELEEDQPEEVKEDQPDEVKEEEEETKKEDQPEDPDAHLTPEERERKEKEEYIWRFRILKKKYPNPKVDIPDYNEHSELSDMKAAYDRTTRELYLDGAVDSYRTYLVGGFMVTEFVCTNWMNIDLSGFTVQQSKMMYKYDMLLIELGEKSYNRWGMNLPVEIRLAGLIILQAGLFYLGKVITANCGSGLASVFKGLSGQPPDKSEIEDEEPVKKKMKGPKFKAEDIRNMTKAK